MTTGIGMVRIKPFHDFNTEWTKDAACVREEGFYPVLNEKFEDVWTDEHKAQAKAICAQCSVKPMCLDYAIVGREDEGIWGETLPSERRKIRLERAKSLAELMNSIDKEVSEIADVYIMAGELLS